MGRTLSLTAKDGHGFSAYIAEPDQPPKGAVVVVQEIFGVNRHIRAVAEKFAALGHVAIAPALFDRIERDVELGYDEAGVTRGRAIVDALGMQGPLHDVAATVSAARSIVGDAGKIGAVGYCWGGAVVWLAAAQMPGLSAVVSYYGSRIAQFRDRPPAVPTMLHVGRDDATFPMEIVRDIGRLHPGVTIHDYPAGHGFNCDERSSYDAMAADLALNRTLDFLAKA